MAAKALHAFDYLAQPQKHVPRAVCVVFGDELFLRRQAVRAIRRVVLGGDEGEFSLSTFDGSTAELADVLGELATVAMFGPGQRLVVVEGADEFVSRYRAELEDYVAQPTGRGVLVLDVKAFPGNTRLYKAVVAEGLAIDCKCPAAAGVVRWLGSWAVQAHRVQVSQAAAEMLVEMIGSELGLLDQELAKLALLTGSGQKITPEMVGRLAGGWRARTAWDLLDAVLAGQTRQAETIIEVQKNSRRSWGFPCRRPTTAGASHEGHRGTLAPGEHGSGLPQPGRAPSNALQASSVEATQACEHAAAQAAAGTERPGAAKSPRRTP